MGTAWFRSTFYREKTGGKVCYSAPKLRHVNNETAQFFFYLFSHSLGDGQLLSRPLSEDKCAVLSDKEDLPSVISEEVCHVYSGKCHELMNYLFKPQWVRAASSLAARSNRLFWDPIKLFLLRLAIAKVSGGPNSNSFWNIKESLYRLLPLHCIFIQNFSTKPSVNSKEHQLLASLQYGHYQKILPPCSTKMTIILDITKSQPNL